MTIFVTALVSIIATLIVMLVILNLSSHERYLDHEIDVDFGAESEDFNRSMGSLLGPALMEGNAVETYVNGCHFFPAMLEAMEQAKCSITLETFIYWSGEVGKRFTDLLIRKADEGVRVYLLVDWIGSWKMEKDLMKRIQASKVRLECYRPLNWHNLLSFNNRTHRKLLVIDGKIGFTGGAGIADSWDGDAEDAKHWRDSQFRLEGPAVAQMQAAFMDNWMQTHSEVLLGDEFFPKLEKVGDMRAQVFKSGPGEGTGSARLMHLVSLACARKSIRLAHGYFIPDNLSVKTLVDALERGVSVEIIVQGPTDAPQARRAGRSRWRPLLEAGAKIYEYQQAMFHCKTMIVDDSWVSVGSVNFDNRSFRLNDEANLNIQDHGLAAQQIEIFEQDKQHSRQVTFEEYERRPGWDHLFDRALGLLRHQF